eukprot:167101_1
MSQMSTNHSSMTTEQLIENIEEFREVVRPHVRKRLQIGKLVMSHKMDCFTFIWNTLIQWLSKNYKGNPYQLTWNNSIHTIYLINLIECIQLFGFANVIKCKGMDGKYLKPTHNQIERIKLYLIIEYGHVLNGIHSFFRTQNKEKTHKKKISKIYLMTQALIGFDKHKLRMKCSYDCIQTTGKETFIKKGECL